MKSSVYKKKKVIGMHNKLISKSGVIIAVVWSALFVFFIMYNIKTLDKEIESLALAEARANVQKDLALRSWVASHGGVYVPVDEHTKPNQYLQHVANKNVITNAGQHLTLMNPAYVLTQMMKDYSELYGLKSKITSHKLINPNNAPDTWEDKALSVIESTKKPYYATDSINGQLYLRYMTPMMLQQSCLKCHGFQGYKVGDVRGGISVSVPLKSFYAAVKEHLTLVNGAFALVWLAGMFGIYIVFGMIQKSLEERIKTHEENVFSLVDIIEQRDAYTAGHSRRVAEYSKKIAQAMHLPQKEIELLYRAAILHDIGKIATPDAVLLKPNELSNMEYDLIKEHVTKGYEILSNVSIFKDIAEIVRYHHERYDGKGYPAGITGDQQPLLSSVLCLADSFDAMTTDRIYKGRKSVAQALEEIELKSGSQFHPYVATVALTALKDIKLEGNINQLPSTKLEAQRFAYFYKDQLTGLHNQDYLEFVLTRRGQTMYRYYCACVIYLQQVSKYNEIHGWHNGSVLLKNFSAELEQKFPEAIIFRIFGDDFLILHKEHTETPCVMGFESLKDTGVTMMTQHFDLHDASSDVEKLKSIVFDK